MRLCLAAAVVCLSIAGIALADDTQSRRPINIPAQRLAPALQLLAREWNLQIVFVSEEIGERRTQGSIGKLDPQEALGQLLEGTGLTFKHLDDNTLAIVPAASTAYRARTGETLASKATEPALTPTDPPQVTIEARRQALEDRVFHFVTALTAQVSSHRSLPRWYDEICPQVSGLPQTQREFVLGRMATIARAVGAPLARGKCETNLVVLFAGADATKQVRKLLLGRASQLPASYDVRADIPGLKEFVADPQPIRAWYETQLRDTSGILLQTRSLPGAVPSLENDYILGSHILMDYVESLLSVLVVVDVRRMDGIGIGTAADCAAVLGLAKINPSADVAGTDSVLQLFTAPAEGKTLSQLGTWDVAFLKALYSTAQAGKKQRQVIVRSMMSDDSVTPQP